MCVRVFVLFVSIRFNKIHSFFFEAFCPYILSELKQNNEIMTTLAHGLQCVYIMYFHGWIGCVLRTHVVHTMNLINNKSHSGVKTKESKAITAINVFHYKIRSRWNFHFGRLKFV